MVKFYLKDSAEHYLALSEQPKRFDPDSPVTNVFFDDTNGEVFTVRSGGVTGVTVNGMDESKCTSFRMEDRGPIISIKFSPDHKILAIQRNHDNQNATVEFVNFKDLAPTNVEYAHTCKWKNAKLLGFVWPKVNEIAFITDHGIELLQVMPEKKQLKSLKNTCFSGAWFSWCAQSGVALLAGNNGALLQPYLLTNSTVTKLQKLELESGKPVAERDVIVVRVAGGAWCAMFRHAPTPATIAAAAPPPTEVWLLPIAGGGGMHTHVHVLKTALSGRFAVHIIDDLVVVHHQSSQKSLLYDIMEECGLESGKTIPHTIHMPAVPGRSIQPAVVADQPCPMYSGNWVVFQPDYIIDARLGALWRVRLLTMGIARCIPKDEVPLVVAVLLKRRDGKPAVYSILHQLVREASTHLFELSRTFDAINVVYRRWADGEVARNTAGIGGLPAGAVYEEYSLVSQADMCSQVLNPYADGEHLVQVVTLYLASLCRHDMLVLHPTAELAVRALVTRGACGRLRSLVRRGCLGDSRPLACQLLSLGHIDPAAAQLALDMLWRLRGHEEVVEVLLSWHEPIPAVGAARQAGGAAWAHLAARKLLSAARAEAEQRGEPTVFLAIYHALIDRNERLRGAPHFLKVEQCDRYVEYYKQLTSEQS